MGQQRGQLPEISLAHGQELCRQRGLVQVRREAQREHALETGQQPQEVVVEIPSRQRNWLEAVGQLGVGLYRAEGVLGADADDGHLQFVAEILQHVEKAALLVEVAGEDVVHLVDDQHLQAHETEQLEHLGLLAVDAVVRPVGREQPLEDRVVEAALVRRRRRLDDQDWNQDAFAVRVVPGRMAAAEALHQHALAVVRLAYEEQVGHAVRARIGQEVLEFAQYRLSARIADPARGADALDALLGRKLEHLPGLGRKVGRFRRRAHR